MSHGYPVRAISPAEYPAFTAVAGEAFLEPWPPEALEVERSVLEFDRTAAAFDGTQMVGFGSSYSFSLTVPGASAPAAGISNVSVLPSYRRRGILTAMMRHLLADALDRGEALAILFASESAIYSRYGFGLASWQQRFTIARGDGVLRTGGAAPDTAGLQLRSAVPEEVRPELGHIYATALPGRPGSVARDDRWWQAVLADPPALRDGMSPLRCLLAEDSGGPGGYALYRTKPSWEHGVGLGILRVRELIASGPAVTAALWSDLLTRDLVGEVTAPVRPVDDPLLAMLADPRRAHPAVSDGLWVRLADVPAALCKRRYTAGIDVVLDVIDPVLPDNAGRWRLQSAGPDDPALASCERSGAAADVLLTVQALGAAYLGGASFGQLAGAGHVRELTPGAMATLAAAMSHDPAPWACMVF